MSPMYILSCILVGLAAGTVGGLVGLGGGIIMIPAMIYLFGMSQHMAQGTSLAVMLPPIGLLAALEYYRHGNADLKVAGLICLGFFFGGYFGARLANALPNLSLQRVFAIALLLISLRMLIRR